MTSQFSGYIWGTGQLIGRLCDSVYANVIELGELPNSDRKCSTHKVNYSECKSKHAKFELLLYSRTPEQLERWRLDMIGLAERARVYFQIFNSVEMLPWAERNGAFTEKCTFCGLQTWCRLGFRKESMEELTVFAPWRPWEGKMGKIEPGGEGKIDLEDLWLKGRDEWMRVWMEKREMQEEMARFAKGKLGD